MLDLIWKDPPDDCLVKFPVLDRRVVGRIVLDPQHIGVPVFSGRALDLKIILMKRADTTIICKEIQSLPKNTDFLIHFASAT